jgi:hypothetical protein
MSSKNQLKPSHDDKFDTLERIILRIILLLILLIGGIKLILGEVSSIHLPLGTILSLF